MRVFRSAVLIGIALSSAVAMAGTTGPSPGELGRWVNPFLGTGGIYYLCGNVSPAATTPFGMVRLGPDTVSSQGRRAANTSGYYFRDRRILGFSHTRLSGTGATDGGNFLVAPFAGAGDLATRRNGLNAPFDHRQEAAFPGYYSLKLPEMGVDVELTASKRVGVHRYRFAAGKAPHLALNATSVLGRGSSKDGELKVLPAKREIEGAVRSFGTFSKRYGGLKTYFVARVDRPFSIFTIWQGKTVTVGKETATGDDIGVDLEFPPANESRPIQLNVAISYVSVANARANLDAEVGDQGFEQIFQRAKTEWEEYLGRIRVEGGTETQRTIFYTSLYHSLLMPTTFMDSNGEYLGFDGKVHRAADFTYCTDLSLWDTFRTTHPLYNWIAAREQRDMLRSLVEMARQGGYLPRWPSGAGYTNSMFGTPADLVIAEAYLKGIRDFDVTFAYERMKKTALGPTVNSRFSGRSGIEDYLHYRYCPSDKMKQSVARTLEYCYADHSIALLSEALGHRNDAAMFRERSRYYRNLWNPQTKYFQPRDSKGAFQEFRPLLLTYLDLGGKYTHAYVEGSALQWRWGAPQDAEGLIGLFDSPGEFARELDLFFARSEPAVGVNPNPYYWHGNQPDLHAAFLFNAAGRPDLTQKWVRWILEKKYGAGENGLDGNDDGGTLSAWYVLASLGIYPIAGTDRYELCSPIWTRAHVRMGTNAFLIEAPAASSTNGYVRALSLNGTPVERRSLRHQDIAAGGALRFDLAPHLP